MADKSPMLKVDNKAVQQVQAQTDKHFVIKSDQIQLRHGKKMSALKTRSKLVGLLLTGGVFGIYGYSLYAVQRGKLMEEFDKVPE